MNEPRTIIPHPSYVKEPAKDKLSRDNVNQNSEHAAEVEEPRKPWEQCLREGMCSSKELGSINIIPPKLLVGDWLREGDLGFIFAQRGIGKTWLALDLAHGIAEKANVGPWETHTQGKCVYLDGEMPPDDIKKRDYALGKPSENLTYINHELLFEKTGRVMNIADSEFQQGVLALCLAEKFQVLFLDNLSCLASGVDENKGMDWEIILPWLLRLRRAHITVIFVAHAGRNNQMRGHTKREDPAFWILRLDAPLDVNESRKGAHFITRFTKWRSIQKPATYQWSYTPAGSNNEDICVEWKVAAPIDVFRQLVESGMDTSTDISEEMDVTKGYVSQLASRGQKEGWLEITKRHYYIRGKN
jgi:AAA domain